MELPTSYSKAAVDEIVKARNLKDVTIKVESGSAKGDNYIGEIFRIKVYGVNSHGSKESMSMIMKIAPRAVEFRQKIPVEMFFRREIFAYTKMLPVLSKIQEEFQLSHGDKFRPAKLLKSLAPETGEMLIFEDLSIQGFKMYDRKIPFNYDHLSFAIKNIARYHATSIVLKAKNPDLFNEIAAQTSNSLDFGEAFGLYVDKCIKKTLSIIEDPDDRDYLIDYFQNKLLTDLQKFVNSETCAPYNVLCHGDCWSNNFLFAYQNGRVCDMRMLDWQMIRCASPVTDISYAMFTSMDEEMRRKYYNEILELYYHSLSNNVSKMGYNASTLFPKYIYKEQIKTTMRYGLIMSIVVLPLTLADKDNVPDLDILFDKEAGANVELFFSETCTTRLRSLIKFCMKEKII